MRTRGWSCTGELRLGGARGRAKMTAEAGLGTGTKGKMQQGKVHPPVLAGWTELVWYGLPAAYFCLFGLFP